MKLNTPRTSALKSSVPYKSVNQHYDVDSKVPELNLLVNDCLRPVHYSVMAKRHSSLLVVVTELKLNSVIPPPDTIEEVETFLRPILLGLT